MKYVLFGVIVFFIYVLPMYLFNTLVIPGLSSLKRTYANAGAFAENVATQPIATTR